MKWSSLWRRSLWVVFLGVALSLQSAAAQAQEPVTMTDRQACRYEKETFPLNQTRTAVHLVKDGLLLDIGKKKHEALAYADMKKIVFSPGAFVHADIYIYLRDKRGSYFFEFFLTQATNEKVQTLQNALTTLMRDAQQGKSVVCSDNPQDYADTLADFEQKTAAWRAQSPKPAVSDEVYKDRLLAEDALKNRNLAAAANYYEAGVAAEPTWDQGWYDVALVYEQLEDYFDAAQCMKHYVILRPDAPDVRAAKDNIILWEAKAPMPTNASASQSQLQKSVAGTMLGSGRLK